MKHKKAFTLIEALVVILVIVVILSIMSSTRRRTTPRRVICLSQLRGIGLCTMMYADDNNDCLPMAKVVYPKSAERESKTYYWYQFFAPYRTDDEGMTPDNVPANYDYSKYFKCPEFISPPDGWQLGYGMAVALYGMDGKPPTSINDTQYLNWLPEGVPYETLTPAATGGEAYHRFFKRSEFSDAARRGWLGDSSDWTIGGGPETTPYDPNNRLWPTWNDGSNPELNLGRDPERHEGSSNIWFLDGHAKEYKYNVGGNAFYDIQKFTVY